MTWTAKRACIARSNLHLASMIIILMGTSTLEAQNRRAVIFAPAEYGEISTHTSALLHNRLLRCGFESENIRLLTDETSSTATALEDTLIQVANTTRSQDVLFVAICSPGVRMKGTDYILSSGADLQSLTRRDSNGAELSKQSLVQLQDIVDWMSRSASSQQFLLVDGTPSAEFAESKVTTQFGRQPLETSLDGQYVLVNRSGRMWSVGDSPPTHTYFIQAIHEGLVGYADLNKDNRVSLLELADYTNLYSEETGFQRPQQYGKARADVMLASVSHEPDDPARLPEQLREELARQLLKAATTSLLLEFNVAGAKRAIERASLYSAGTELQTEIESMALTIQATDDPGKALTEASRRSLPLLVVAPNDAELKYSTEVVGNVRAGQLMQISKRSKDWFRVTQLFTVSNESGDLQLTSSPAKGYISLNSLQPTNADRTPNLLIARLITTQEQAMRRILQAHAAMLRSDVEGAKGELAKATELDADELLTADINSMRLSIEAASDPAAALEEAKSLEIPLRVYVQRDTNLRQSKTSNGSVSKGTVLRVSTIEDKWLWCNRFYEPRTIGGHLSFVEREDSDATPNGWLDSSALRPLPKSNGYQNGYRYVR